MTNEIKQMVEKCSQCMKFLPSLPPEPLIQTLATRPFEKVSLDLFQITKNYYLVVADRYSGWPLVEQMSKTNTTSITDVLQEWFIDHGKPNNIRHDGGPNVDSNELDQWCTSQGIGHTVSSAYHHPSNGHAEAAVKSMKYLLKKCDEDWNQFRIALREWRNTKRADGFSPAEWYFGRRQRTNAVAHPDAYKRIDDETFAKHEEKRKELVAQSKSYFDRHTTSHIPLEEESRAMMQNQTTKRWDIPVTVADIRPTGSYWVISDDGGQYLRNRRFLRPITNDSSTSANSSQTSETPESSSSSKTVTQRKSSRPPKPIQSDIYEYEKI